MINKDEASYHKELRKIIEPTCCLACRVVIKGPCDLSTFFDGIMYLCPLCGNKRCPRLKWHGYKCTNSNEPDQEPERII